MVTQLHTVDEEEGALSLKSFGCVVADKGGPNLAGVVVCGLYKDLEPLPHKGDVAADRGEVTNNAVDVSLRLSYSLHHSKVKHV
jgi:hypothetical protein